MKNQRHYFETAQICLHGHVATLNYGRNEGERTSFCPTCGERTIHECPQCHAPIRGAHYISGLVTTGINVLSHESYQAVQEQRVDKDPYTVPAYCNNCGAPFPWTQSAIAEASNLVDEEMTELNDEEKSKFKSALPEVIRDTSTTKRASILISKYLKKVSPIAQEAFKQVFYRLVADGARLLIWGL